MGGEIADRIEAGVLRHESWRSAWRRCRSGACSRPADLATCSAPMFTAGPCAVVDWPKAFRQLLAEQARGGVGGGAGRVRNDDADRLSGQATARCAQCNGTAGRPRRSGGSGSRGSPARPCGTGCASRGQEFGRLSGRFRRRDPGCQSGRRTGQSGMTALTGMAADATRRCWLAGGRSCRGLAGARYAGFGFSAVLVASWVAGGRTGTRRGAGLLLEWRPAPCRRARCGVRCHGGVSAVACGRGGGYARGYGCSGRVDADPCARARRVRAGGRAGHAGRDGAPGAAPGAPRPRGRRCLGRSQRCGRHGRLPVALFFVAEGEAARMRQP